MAQFVDNFDRPAENLEDSPDWELASGSIGAAVVNSSEQVAFVTTDPLGALYLSPDLGSPNHSTKVTVLQDGSREYFDIAVRSIDRVNMIGAIFNNGSWRVFRREPGNIFTELGSADEPSNVGDEIELRAQGDELRLLRNGSLIIGPVTETFNNTVTRQGIAPRRNALDPAIDSYVASTLDVEVFGDLDTTDLIDNATIPGSTVAQGDLSTSDPVDVLVVQGSVEVFGVLSTVDPQDASFIDVEVSVETAIGNLVVDESQDDVDVSGSIAVVGEINAIEQQDDYSISARIIVNITFPLRSPIEFGFPQIEWGPMTNTSRARSPWSFEDVAQVFEGEMWHGVLTITPLTDEDARRFTSWLVALQGRRGTFFLGDPSGDPRGAAANNPGNPVIDGSDQVGSTVLITGVPSSVNNWLREGDYIQIGEGLSARLHMVLLDSDTTPEGRVTLRIWPKLRSPTINGTIVNVTNPQGVFSLSNSNNSWSVRHPAIYEPRELEVEEVV